MFGLSTVGLFTIVWDYDCLSSLLLLAKSIVGVHERTQPLWCCNDKVGVVIRQYCLRVETIGSFVFDSVSCSKFKDCSRKGSIQKVIIKHIVGLH